MLNLTNQRLANPDPTNPSENVPVLWLADVRLWNDEADRLWDDERLSSTRRDKIRRYRNRDDKLRSLVAGILLNRILGDRVHKIERNEFGKPFLGDGPFFNLSHSGNLVALAIDSQRPVGCDVQRRDGTIRPEIVAKRFFHSAEQEQLHQARPEERERLFYRLWTLKESYLKAIGKGFALSPTSFRLEISPNVVLRETSERGPSPFFRLCEERPEYEIAVCSFSPLDRLSIVAVEKFE